MTHGRKTAVAVRPRHARHCELRRRDRARAHTADADRSAFAEGCALVIMGRPLPIRDRLLLGDHRARWRCCYHPRASAERRRRLALRPMRVWRHRADRHGLALKDARNRSRVRRVRVDAAMVLSPQGTRLRSDRSRTMVAWRE
jgi:hypothetical protein